MGRRGWPGTGARGPGTCPSGCPQRPAAARPGGRAGGWEWRGRRASRAAWPLHPPGRAVAEPENNLI